MKSPVVWLIGLGSLILVALAVGGLALICLSIADR
jgi:hypothetical protein